MEHKIISKINLFNAYLDLDLEHNTDISLCNGIGSLPVYYYMQYKLTQEKEHIGKIHDIISGIIEIINETDVMVSYCNGIVGAAHVFNFIKNKDILNTEALADIEDALLTIDENVAEYYFSQTKSIEDIDFLHGAFGAAFYLVERLSDNTDPSFQQKVTQLFELLCHIILYEIKETDKVKEIKDSNEDTHVTNCGLAHGHISYIIILSKFLEKLPENNLVRETLSKSVKCVLGFESTNESNLSQFPSIAINAATANYSTSLGWCYGDQTISLGLYKAGCILNDKALKEKALALAYKNLNRDTTEKMFSSRDNYDACFCHGLSSVAYIYKKWYLISKDEKFFNEYEKLTEAVLKFGEKEKGIAGYQKRLGDGRLEDSIGLLDGVIGIGMFLIDYLLEFDDCGWDNLFLLDVQ